MCYDPDWDSHDRDKAKVVIDLSNYATKRELDHDTGINTTELTTSKVLLLWKLKLIN